MKSKTKATLRKLGMILAVALLFSALAVPVWAEGEGGAQPDGAGTAGAADTQPGNTVSPGIAPLNDTAPISDPTSPSGSEANSGTSAALPRAGVQEDNGNSSGDSSGVTTPPEPNVPVAGDLYVTGYTVLNEIGGVELQRIEANQKCTIIVSVADKRFQNFTSKEEVVNYVTNGNVNEHVANVKVTSTGSFASPSLGDIYASGEKFEDGVFLYAIVLHDIKYLGGDNKLSLDIGYTQTTLPLVSVSQAISQCADASAEGAKDSALVLTSASYGGGSVEAGQDFTLTVDVLAPDKYAGAENVKVIITPPEQFTSASGSTMVYVGDLKPGATRQVTFQLNASAVAQSGSYAINVNVTGTSMASGAAAPSDSMSVTVPITQPERFEISRTDLPEYLSMGEEGYASVSFVNKGKGTIYNVSAEITGEGITTTEGNLYVGNVLSGTESSADFTIQTSQSGTLSAVLTVTYEDEKGNVKELTKDFSMTVEEMNMGIDDPSFDPGFDPMPMPEEPQGMPVWGWILIAVGVLAAGGAAFFIIKKKKAKKKAAQLTEDDDEDL